MNEADVIRIAEDAAGTNDDAAVKMVLARMVVTAVHGMCPGYVRANPSKPANLKLDKQKPIS